MNLAENEVARSPLSIVSNTLPKNHLGQWLSEVQRLDFRIKPAYDNEIVSLEVSPIHFVLDAGTRVEKFRFQTRTVFEFSGLYSSSHLQNLAYQLLCLSVDEFNEALKSSGSMLALGRKMDKPTWAEMASLIDQGLKDRQQAKKAGVTPHWGPNKTTEDNNDEIIKALPDIPPFKRFQENTTRERDAISRGVLVDGPTKEDLHVLNESITFYETCFAELERINLGKLSKEQAERLTTYLHSVFATIPFLTNELTVGEVYRATVINDSFLENGKVRHQKYLQYPPLSLLQQKGTYNRCSSCNLNLFYACEQKNVPFREIKPSAGDRVIESTWLNISGKPLHYRPICLTPGVFNRNTDQATLAFEQLFGKLDPTILLWMQTIFAFIAKQFIKESEQAHPLRYEYFYSAYFSDAAMQPVPEGIPAKQVECIVYPSVAWDHIPSNIAIHPDIVDKKFRLIEAKEYEVLQTWYDRPIGLHDYPLKLSLIRSSKQIRNGEILWSDD